MHVAKRRWPSAGPLTSTIVLGLLTAVLVVFYRPLLLAGMLQRPSGATFTVALGGALLALFGLLALLRPDLALLLALATPPLFQRSRGFFDASVPALDGKFFPLHELLLILLSAITVVHAGWHWLRGSRWRLPWRDWLLPLAWLLIGLLAVLIATPDGMGAARREWRWTFIEPLLAYGLVRFWGRSAATRRNIVLALIGSGAMVGLVALLQRLGHDWTPIEGLGSCYSDPLVSTGGTIRTAAVYCHPNNLALWLDRIWPLALVALVACWRPAQTPTLRVRAGLLALALGLTGLGLLLSLSKGALVVGGLMLIGLAALTGRRRLAGGLALAAGVTVVLLMARGPERLNLAGDSTFARLSLWRSAGRMLHDHPLTGIGLDQFYFYYNPEFQHGYIEEAVIEQEKNTAHPHNLVLDLLLRVGVVGTLVFGLIIARGLRRGWRVWRSPHAQGWMGLAALGALITGLLHGLVDQGYFAADLAVITWTLLGLIDALASEVYAQQAHDPALPTTGSQISGAECFQNLRIMRVRQCYTGYNRTREDL